MPPTAGIGQFGAIQAVAPSVGVDLRPIDCATPTRSSAPSRRLRATSNGGLIVTAAGGGAHRDLIITLAARHTLPAVYSFRYFVATAVSSPMGPIPSILIAVRQDTSIAFLKARYRPICPFKPRPSTNRRSTSRPPRLSASKCRRSLLARADEVIE